MPRKEKAQKNSFILFHDYWTELERLSLEQRGKWITAVFDHEINFDHYQQTGQQIEIDDQAVDVIFARAKANLIVNRKNFFKTSESRTNSAKSRWDKDKQKDANEYNCIQTQPDNDNVLSLKRESVIPSDANALPVNAKVSDLTPEQRKKYEELINQ